MLNKRIEYDAKVPIRAYVSRIYEQPVHNHLDDLEIIVVLKGSVKEIVGYRTILLKEGEVMIINDRDIHGIYETEEDNLVLTIHLNVSYFKKFNEAAYSDFFLMAATYLNDMRYDRPVEELREKLFDIARVQITQSGSDDKMDTLGKELLAKLLEDFQYFYYSTAVGGYFINKFEGKNNQAQAARIRSLMYYLWENYSQKITLQEYADENHINMYYLSHIIKEATGRTATEWIDHFVILEAKNLLRYSGLNIQQIAYDLNFHNQSAFGKYFKHLTGVSPSDFRKG
jgi:xylan 1,4-beta-xylosidase